MKAIVGAAGPPAGGRRPPRRYRVRYSLYSG